MIDCLPLLRSGKQPDCRVISHRHIVEEPDEQRSALYNIVKESLAGNVRIVLTGITGGNAKGEMMFL